MSSTQALSDIDLHGNRVRHSADPVEPDDLSTKGYVDFTVITAVSQVGDGQLSDAELLQVSQDVAEELIEQLEPPVNLTVLFENALQ
jgi:hypothetical protein